MKKPAKFLKHVLGYEDEAYALLFNKEALREVQDASEKVLAGKSGELEKVLAKAILSAERIKNND